MRPRAAKPTTAGRPRLGADLDRWVAVGLLTKDQAAAITDYEAGTGQPARTTPATAPTATRGIPVVAEALGYLGGMLAVIGLVLLVAHFWPDLAPAARLALSGGGAIVLVATGTVVRGVQDPGLRRLRGFLWLGSTAATGLFAGVLAVDGLGAEAGKTIALACSAGVVVESALLWRWRELPVQQLTALGGLVVATGTAIAQFAHDGFIGMGVWVIGAAYVVAGLHRRTPRSLITIVVGALSLMFGANIASSNWQGFGLLAGVATALGLLALAFVPRTGPIQRERIVVGALGGFALLQGVPPTLSYFAERGGMATGLATWAIGTALIVIGSRHLVRGGRLAEAAGGTVVLGGAAITGVQSADFAPLFGLATAVGLVGLGMLPGRVLLSVLGSVGLLVNVPWATSRFFPGEATAPLLIMVSGAVIIAVAVLLTRIGGRFRRELGSRAEPRAS